MRRSEYIVEVLRSIGTGLVVGSILMLLTEQTTMAFVWIVYGLFLIALGYIFLEEG